MLKIQRPAAVLFDCDGLLMETESHWDTALFQVFESNGVELTEEFRKAQLGVNVDEVAKKAAKIFPEHRPWEQYRDDIVENVTTLIKQYAQPMPGAVELVEIVASNQIPMAVVSNSPRPMVVDTLIRGKLDHYFPILITAEDVTNRKPAPDIYLKACAALNVAPVQAVAFEDSLTGVTAAKRAGLYVIAVPTFDDKALDADLVVPSLADQEIVAWANSW
ncbi:MAG: HAD family phosphatase [Propionibacteriaceae bacterium]|nr:HAD family phosphatase [Propionibacteriaceae bacterium]